MTRIISKKHVNNNYEKKNFFLINLQSNFRIVRNQIFECNDDAYKLKIYSLLIFKLS